MRIRSGVVRAALPLLGFVFAPAAVHATDAVLLTFENSTTATAADLHVRLAGVGTPAFVIVDPASVTAPAACGIASIPSNPPTVTDTVVIDWGFPCVPPGVKVSFIVVAPNAAPGALSVVSCVWTDAAGATIGPCKDCGFVNIPNFPIGALKVQYRYTPLGPVFYTKWRRIAGRPCWWRWCCNPWGWCCERRLIYCPFTLRLFRLFEVPPWLPVTAWAKIGFLPPAYWWQRTTVPPPPGQRANGAWFDGGGAIRGHERPARYDLDVRYTDDGGQTFRQGADLTSAAYDAYDRLLVTAPLDPNNIDPNGPPAATGFANTLQFIGPGYFDAGLALQPLINEIDDVRAHEPSALLDQIRVDVEIVSLSLVSIGSNFSAGTPGPIADYIGLSSALNDLGTDLAAMGTSLGTNRFQNTAETLTSMREGVDEAINQLSLGLPDPCSEDLFTWGMMNRFVEGWRHVATSTMPHVRVRLNLGNYVWFPSSSEGATVVIQEANSREILDEFVTPVADTSTIDLVVFDTSVPLRVWIKLPTHLSRVIDIPTPSDGLVVNAPLLIQGDVNGDNCVDAADVAQINADLGTGGPTAESISSSDVNADGVVDANDLGIALAASGLCGESLPCRGDTDGDNDVDLTDLAVVLAQFGQTGAGLAGDVNNDGTVNLSDLAIVLAVFGSTCV